MNNKMNFILNEEDLHLVGFSPTMKIVKKTSENILLKNNLSNKIYIVGKENIGLYNFISKLISGNLNEDKFRNIQQSLSKNEKENLAILVKEDIIRVNYSFIIGFLKRDYYTLSENIENKLLLYNGFSLIIKKTLLEKLVKNCLNDTSSKEYQFKFDIPEGYPKDNLSLIEIEMTNICNLNCKYCYVDKENQKTISENVLNDILDFIEKKNIKCHNLTIQFFGGEPLLEFDKIRYFVSEAKKRKLNLNYVIQTNGTNITDDICEYCKQEKIGLGFSSDGSKEVNNNVRPFKKSNMNSGSLINDGILKADNHNLFGGIMAVLTKYNTPIFEDIIEKWTTNYSDVSLKISPLLHNPHISKDSLNISVTPTELSKSLITLSRLHKKIPNFQWKDLTSIRDQIVKLELNDLCSSRGCRFGNNLISINQDGDVYPCTHLSDQVSYKISNIKNINYNSEIIQFTDKIKKHKFAENCESCFLWAFCRGGCISQTLNRKFNDQKESYTDCDYKKLLFKTVGDYILDDIS